jgi:hypothetical protein
MPNPLRGSFLLRRMGASRQLIAGVLVAILVTASLTAALAAFSARGLPQAVRSQLAAAPDVSIAISGQIDSAQATADSAVIRSPIRSAFGGVPVRLDGALWSDSLGLPARGGSQTIPLAEAAAPDQIAAHTVLVSGMWPGPPRRGQPIGAALPAAVASQLHLAVGALLVLPDRDTGARVRLRLTGLFQPRDLASPYWNLDLIGTSGVSVRGNFVTYGPLIALAGGWLAGELATAGSLRAARLRVSGLPRSAWWVTAAILLLCTVTMVWPALRLVQTPGRALRRPAAARRDRPGPRGQPRAAHRRRAGRPAGLRDRTPDHAATAAVVRSEGITALVATHDTALIDLADDVLRLEDGRICGQ